MVSFSEKSEEREFMERRASIWFCRLSLLCVSDIEWRCQPNSWYGSLELSGTTAQGRALLGLISRMQHLSHGTSELCRAGVVCRECKDRRLPRAQPWDFPSLKPREGRGTSQGGWKDMPPSHICHLCGKHS